MAFQWHQYPSQFNFDEAIDPKSQIRGPSKQVAHFFGALSPKEIDTRQNLANATIEQMGITFRLYSNENHIDRPWPYDIIPRTIDSSHWQSIEKGLIQRLEALNCFINDIYHQQHILKDHIIPRHLVLKSRNFLPECQNVTLPYNVWAHICGTDLVRDHTGEFFVLEDNLRVPSGVSYMLENREVTKRVLPELFDACRILPNNDYPTKLFECLSALSPRQQTRPTIVVLTPGIFNSAYFEHAYLAQQIGAELVEGRDLYTSNERIFMKTISGPKQVDVIYRRVDDTFLDPYVFRKESLLGVPGLIKAWQKGNVAIANAPGSGVADDKAIYSYVPKFIRYYLDEEPLIPNVKTFLCEDEKQREHVLNNIKQLVVKPVNESGGYGMIIGPQADENQLEEFTQLIKTHPSNYVAQPTLSLSTSPTLAECGQIEPRHLDLRPFILQSSSSYVTAGGLTRVAMTKGSLVVNSSQGGGSKDTWIVDKADTTGSAETIDKIVDSKEVKPACSQQ